MNDQEHEVKLYDFQSERGVYDSIISDWNEENTKCKDRRKLRENRKNVDEERQQKKILEDETIIPDRTINTNIRRSKLSYVNYITQAKRALIITDFDDPNRDTEQLELWFTRGMRFPGWKTPWIRLIDSFHTHGGSACEVVYDTTKPFNCAIEYIPRNSLLFPKGTKSLQACPRLLRRYKITALELETLSDKYGFEKKVVENILSKYSKKQEMLVIYKAFSKKAGIAYSCWYTQDDTSTWLKGPLPHQVGLLEFDPNDVLQLMRQPEWIDIRASLVQPRMLKEYPLYWFPLDETEDEELLNGQGRVALDLHVQEALTSMVSSTVNGAYRASNLYPTAENMPGDDPKMGELGPIKPGVISSRKLVINQFPWPQPIILAIMQALGIRNAQDAGQTNFASMARKDANKTAKEMEISNSEQQGEASYGINIFSTPYLDTFALCFLIATHQATFGLCQSPQNPLDLFGNYSLQPAGDIEVIKRLEDRENAKAFFDLTRGTPISNELMKFMFLHFFPDQEQAWEDALNSDQKTQQMAAMMGQMLEILKNIPQDALTSEQQSGLGSVIAAAQSMVESSNNNVAGQNAPPAASRTP